MREVLVEVLGKAPEPEGEPRHRGSARVLLGLQLRTASGEEFRRGEFIEGPYTTCKGVGSLGT